MQLIAWVWMAKQVFQVHGVDRAGRRCGCKR